ncbi:MAG: hypothetical protein WAK93_08485 [Solirubrobacteraceae bacterium]
MTPNAEQVLAPAPGGELPELANVRWRKRVDEGSLRRADRLWTLSAVAHQVPFVVVALVLPILNPIMIPVALVALAFAWIIPALYASRGVGALRQPARAGDAAENRALGLLGDLVGHDARELLTATGMVLERGELGVWLVAGAGALLVRPGGRRVQCYCVRATGEDLPLSDRIAHLLLALRADERGFATVANLTFSGACWRVRRRLDPPGRQALRAATRAGKRG